MNDLPDTRTLQDAPTVAAPDGSTVRPLCRLAGAGSVAHFTLAAGRVSKAVSHRTAQEIWYVVGGAGWMWRRLGGYESIVELEAGVCVTVPLGTVFQFRAADGVEPLQIVAATIPPWPTDGGAEARPEQGPWPSTV